VANTTIQVVVDEKVKKELRGLAKAEKRTLSNLAATLLESALQARQSSKEQAA
jgi:mRNA-degrading endonuclease RelE of RelBE toxin-antitoxin system